MKKKRKATTNISYDEMKNLFLPEEVLNLLCEISELRGYNISMNKHDNGTIEYIVNGSSYKIVCL